MPMASAVAFSPNPESYVSSVRPSDFQNASYPVTPLFQGIHVTATEQDACRRLSSDPSIHNPTESYRGASIQETHNPYLVVIEQPKSKWRYRYQSEKGSHGGLPGCTSMTNKRTFPTVKLVNFSGSQAVYVRASLWTDEDNPTMHVHKLYGQRCEPDGSCVIKLKEDKIAIFQDVTILFVAKKEVTKTLFKRKLEKYNLACISDVEKERLRDEADQEAKNMNLNSVKICFEAFYYAVGSKECTLLCPQVFSDPVMNLKSPDAGDLKICRMSRVSGSVVGGDEVFLFVSKVNKRDIMVRFLESDSGWEDFGKFTEADVHYQYGIAFQTPPYHRTDIKNPVTVFLQLQRKNGEVGEPKEFTYIPHDTDDEGMRRKRRKNNPYQEFDESGSCPYEALGVPDCNSRGGIQTSAVGNEPLNGSSLGSNSSLGHNGSLESFLMESFDEEVFDGVFSENSSENSSMDGSFTALIKPHQDPLLSEANVQRPKWNLPDKPSNSMQVENAPTHIKSDTVSHEATRNTKDKFMAHGFIQCKEEIQHTFSKLTISEERSTKESRMNSSFYFVNPHDPLKKFTEIPSAKDGHNGSRQEVKPLKKGVFQDTVFSDLFAKRIWSNLSLAVVSGNPFFFLKKKQHLINFSNEDGDTLLHLAVIHHWRNTNLVESLLKISEDVPSFPINLTNKEQQTPLHLAVITKKHSLVKLLLQYGADPMFPDRNGYTSIHLAVNINSANCLAELLNEWNYKSSQQKFHLDHFDHYGLTPLHCAVIGGFTECIRLLCESKADVNCPSKKDGRTPLHFSVDKDPAVLKLLVAQKAINVNAQDYAGNTALHLACALKRHETVRDLMQQEANPLIENFEASSYDPGSVKRAGRTPHDFANEDEEIIRILAGLRNKTLETSSNFDSTSVKRPPVAAPSCRPKELFKTNHTRRKSASDLDKDPVHHAAQGDSGFISGSISELNEETLRQLCKLLDPPSNSWKDLIVFIGADDLIPENILKLAPSSPTKAIIKIFLRDGGDIETLIGALGAANLIEAHSVVKRYYDSKD